MKRIIITSSKFDGEVRVVYSGDYQLVLIDFGSSVLDHQQISWLKAKIPTQLHKDIALDFAPVPVDIIFENYEISFTQFWDSYKLKVNRLRAERLWDKLSKVDRIKAYGGIAVYERYLSKNSWMNKAHPDTYLKNKYWTNEWR